LSCTSVTIINTGTSVTINLTPLPNTDGPRFK
jgi:hypothetical protein